jgi:hypothetical protein
VCSAIPGSSCCLAVGDYVINNCPMADVAFDTTCGCGTMRDCYTQQCASASLSVALAMSLVALFAFFANHF